MIKNVNKLTITFESNKIIISKPVVMENSVYNRSDEILTLYPNPNFESDTILKFAILLKSNITNKYKKLLEKEVNDGLDNRSVYLEILRYKWKPIDRSAIYGEYDTGRILLDIRGDFIESGKLSKFEATYIIVNLLDIYGVIDIEGFGTYVRLYSESLQMLNTAIPAAMMENNVNGLSKTIKQKTLFYEKLNRSLDITVQLAKGFMLFGYKSNSVLIENVSGFVVVDAHVTRIDPSPNLEGLYRIQEYLEYEHKSHIQLPDNFPRIKNVSQFTFNRDIKTLINLRKFVGDNIVANDLIADIKEHSVLESYNLFQLFNCYNAQDIKSYLSVTDGEFVQAGTCLAKRSFLGSVNEYTIRSVQSGVVDLSGIDNGNVSIIGPENRKTIESGLNGRIVSANTTGEIKIQADAHVFRVRYANVKNSSIIQGNTIFVESINDVDIRMANKWVILDNIAPNEITVLITKSKECSIEGFILPQINLTSLSDLHNNKIRLIIVNGFGDSSFPIRYKLIFSKSNYYNLIGKHLYIT